MDNVTARSVETFWDDMYERVAVDPDLVILGDLDVGPLIDSTSVVGKRVMICSCGTGEHVVRAARMGGDVVAVDISAVGVERARLICEQQGVQAEFLVADLARTGLADGSVDLAWGSAVLHHLDHGPFAAELGRVLSPNGAAVFVSEPTFFNPLFRVFYETCFGKGRDDRRRKFLFIRRRGDDFEKPIDLVDLEPYRARFDVQLAPREFMFFRKVAHVALRHPTAIRVSTWIDRTLDRYVPFVRRFGYEYDITMRRRQ